MSASSEILRDASVIAGSAVGGSMLAKAVGAVITGVPPQHGAFRTHCNRALRKRDTWLTGKKAGAFYDFVGPGNYLKVGLRGYRPVSQQDIVRDIEDFAIPHGDGQIIVRSQARLGVVIDPRSGEIDREAAYRFVYNAKDEEALVGGMLGICGAGLRNVMLGMEDPQHPDHEFVYSEMVKACGAELCESFGAELRAWKLLEAADTIVGAIKTTPLSSFGNAAIAGAMSYENGHSAIPSALENGNLHDVERPIPQP